jgi:hypothetical protein
VKKLSIFLRTNVGIRYWHEGLFARRVILVSFRVVRCPRRTLSSISMFV